MTNKADIITNTRSKLTLNGSVTTRSDHEEILHTQTDSFLEAIYGDGASEDQTGGTYTTSNANFDFNVSFFKVGSNVVLSGDFTANSTLASSSFIFEITDSNLLQLSGSRYDIACVKSGTTDTLPIFLSNNRLITNASVFSGEQFRFQITYKAEN